MAANSQFAVAVHVLTILARAGEEQVTSKYAAASVNTNAVVIRRILSQLVAANLIVTRSGAAGGAKLARPAKNIRLAEVYRAVACGDVFALHAKSPNQDCPVGKNIEAVLCGLQKEIDKSIDATLSRYSLADVMERIREGGN